MPLETFQNSSWWWCGPWGMMWLGFIEDVSRHWVNEMSYLVSDVMMNLWGSGRVCLGKGRSSILDPTDKIPQDENKTKSSHGLRSFSCDSCHMKSKDQLYKILCKHLDCLKGKGITMKYIQCDNAGKQGRKLAELCKAHGIQMEYTAPNMPQQNGSLSRKLLQAVTVHMPCYWQHI